MVICKTSSYDLGTSWPQVHEGRGQCVAFIFTHMLDFLFGGFNNTRTGKKSYGTKDIFI